MTERDIVTAAEGVDGIEAIETKLVFDRAALAGADGRRGQVRARLSAVIPVMLPPTKASVIRRLVSVYIRA